MIKTYFSFLCQISPSFMQFLSIIIVVIVFSIIIIISTAHEGCGHICLHNIILNFSLFCCGYHGSYFGVLMGYGSLLDVRIYYSVDVLLGGICPLLVFEVLHICYSHMQFFREQEPRHITTLVQMRLLPLYKSSVFLPYLVAPANWVLGELASCLPEVRVLHIRHVF